MHRTSYIKFMNVQQSLIIYSYKNTKGKLLKTDGGFCFEKICEINQSGEFTCTDDL